MTRTLAAATSLAFAGALLLRRGVETGSIELLADADGPVHTALMDRGNCGFLSSDLEDAVDMVFIEASMRTNDFSPPMYAKFDLWTAKYTTDPSVVAATKQRVRSMEYSEYVDTPAVGCGYAAVKTLRDRSWGQSSGFQVIRLSDGHAWQLENDSQEQALSFVFGRPQGVTCDEVFAGASARGHGEIVRVRLDSLGPGILPD